MMRTGKVAGVLLTLALAACGNVATPNAATDEVQSGFYQPARKATDSSGAKASKSDAGVLLETPRLETPSPETLIKHEGFAISYNASRCIPNWVAYELTKSETYGDVERTDYFDVDPSITGRQAKFGDYSHTGFDRGHMAPAGDMKWSKEAMDACFYLTNICPQNHALNKGDWNDLEIKCRQLARRYGRAWIVTGPIVTSKEPKTIGSHHVVVPDAFFKAILVPNGSSYAAIAFVMDNAPGDGDIMNDVISIDSLENLTGIDFFYALPDEVEDVVEADYKLSIWR